MACLPFVLLQISYVVRSPELNSPRHLFHMIFTIDTSTLVCHPSRYPSDKGATTRENEDSSRKNMRRKEDISMRARKIGPNMPRLDPAALPRGRCGANLDSSIMWLASVHGSSCHDKRFLTVGRCLAQ